jgi:hypothetical protein
MSGARKGKIPNDQQWLARVLSRRFPSFCPYDDDAPTILWATEAKFFCGTQNS